MGRHGVLLLPNRSEVLQLQKNTSSKRFQSERERDQMARAMVSAVAAVVMLASLSLPLCSVADGYSAGGGGAAGEAKEKLNLAADEVKLMAAETAQGAKDKAESWAEWAQEKISEGLGYRHENAKAAAEKMKGVASDVAHAAKIKMAEATSGAAEKAREVKDAAAEKAGGVADELSGEKDRAMDATGRAYEVAKEKAGEAYETAKGSMTEKAKSGYEAAKEKLSDAAGALGEKMDSARVEEL